MINKTVVVCCVVVCLTAAIGVALLTGHNGVLADTYLLMVGAIAGWVLKPAPATPAAGANPPSPNAEKFFHSNGLLGVAILGGLLLASSSCAELQEKFAGIPLEAEVCYVDPESGRTICLKVAKPAAAPGVAPGVEFLLPHDLTPEQRARAEAWIREELRR